MKQVIVNVMMFISEWALAAVAWLTAALFFSVVWYDMFMAVL